MNTEVWVIYRVNPYEDRDLVAVYDHQPTREDLRGVLALNVRDDYAAEKFTINQITDYHGRGFYHVSESGGLFRYCPTTVDGRDEVFLEDDHHDVYGAINNESNIPKEL